MGSSVQTGALCGGFQRVLCDRIASASDAVILGAMAGYGLARLPYRFGPWRNRDISFWFLCQLILPPPVVAMPIPILYGRLHLLDNQVGLIVLCTVVSVPIVIWIMHDQVNSIPVELEPAALVDGRPFSECSSGS